MADILPFHQKRAPAPEPLWREVLGRSLRTAREEQGGRLVDVAERAGISPQYLSEIERGLTHDTRRARQAHAWLTTQIGA